MTAQQEAATSPLVDVSNVTLRFGGVVSLDDVSLSQQPGEILAVIGPNGAGKTSLFNCLTGVYTPQVGTIMFTDAHGQPHSLAGQKSTDITRLGIAREFQNIRLFNALTAFENVKIGVEAHQTTGPVGAMFRLPHTRMEERTGDERTFELLDFVGLRARANELSSSLPYGGQRRLEIARALGTQPQLLLLDEPAAGTNPAEKRDLEALIHRINDEMGVTVLLIEHDMRLVMSVTHRVVVLNFGKVIAAGTPVEVQRNPAVVEAYLGAPDDGTEVAAMLLQVDQLRVSYGGIEALRGISFDVDSGEIVALLGANGAGKTTTLRTVSGLLHPRAGTITFDGQRIDALAPHLMVRLGIGHVPEGRRIFPRMSVRENLTMGAYHARDNVDADMARVFELFPVLKEREAQDGGTLSGGEQQMLAIGRALMSRPRLLLLDEPSMGLAPMIVIKIFDIIKEINSQGTTVLLVEQNAAQALRLANRGYVLETGEVVMSDRADALLKNDRVREAYLGEGAA